MSDATRDARARLSSADEQHLAKLGYKQELSRSWSGFSNFAISFSIISILAGCFTTFGQAWNNGGPVAISLGLADHLGLHPDHRLHDVRAGLGLPDVGRHLLVGLEDGRPGGRLLHRLAEPDRPARGHRLRGVRRRDVLRPHAQHAQQGWRRRLLADARVHQFVIILALAATANIFSGHLLAIVNNISVWWHVAGAA